MTAVANARTTAWIRDRVLRHVLATGPRATLPEGDLVARLVGNAAQAGPVPATLAATLAAVITPVGGLVALALTDGWTALALLVGMPVLALLLKVFVRASADAGAAYLRAQGEIAGRLTEAVEGARTIAPPATAERDAARILAPLPELSRQGYRMWRVTGRSTAQAAALLPLLQLAVLAVAGLRLADGALSVGGMLAAWRYAVLATGTGVLVGQLNALVRGRAATDRLAEALAPPAMTYGTRRLPDGTGALEFRSVSTGPLRQVDLYVPGGAVAAVVGRSGSGKTALAAVAGRPRGPRPGHGPGRRRPAARALPGRAAPRGRPRLRPPRAPRRHRRRHDRVRRRRTGPRGGPGGGARGLRRRVRAPTAARLRHALRRGSHVRRRGPTPRPGKGVRALRTPPDPR